jgi:hypothetical protein
MTSESTPAVPEYYAQRFYKAFLAFVTEVRAAVAAGALNPAYSSTPTFLIWQTEALPHLEKDLAEIENAYARFQAGETGPLAQLAREQLGLAKHLDGFPLDFAGPEHAAGLDRLETGVVLAAYPLCTLAKIT